MALSRTWYNGLVDDAGLGTNGTPWDKAAVNSLIGAIDLRVRDWTPVAFNAAAFYGAGSMTFTVDPGDIVANQYTIVGRVCVWDLQIAGASIGGTPATVLNLTLPPGVSALSASHCVPVSYLNAGGLVPGMLQVGSSAHLYVQALNGAPFTLNTNGTYLYMQAVFSMAN